MFGLRRFIVAILFSTLALPASEGLGQPSISRTDYHGDPLPPGAIIRLGTQRLLHSGEVRAVAFAPDGKTLASAGADGTVRLWSSANGKELRRFKVSAATVAFSPDGKALLVGSASGTLHLWDHATGAERWQVKAHSSAISAVAWSLDGQLVASAGHDRIVWLWDPATGKARRKLAGHTAPVLAIAFAPDGKTLATGGADRTIRIWETANGNEQSSLQGHKDPIRSLVFTPNGKTLLSAGGADQAAGGDNAVHLWDPGAGIELLKVPGRFQSVPCIALAADGKTLALAGDYDEIPFLDITTARAVNMPVGRGDRVTCVAWSADGKTLACGHQRGRVRLWNKETRAEKLPVHDKGTGRPQVSFGPDGTLLSAGRQNSFAFIDLATGKDAGVNLEPRAHGVLSPTGRHLAAAGWQASTRIWDVSTGKGIELATHLTSGISFSPDGRLLASTEYRNKICIWDTATGKAVREMAPQGIPEGNHNATHVNFAPDGKTLASVTWFTSQERTTALHLWNAGTGKELWWAEQEGEGRINSLAFASDGKTLFTGQDKGVCYLRDPATGKIRKQLPRYDTYFRCLAVSPDGSALAFPVGKDVVLWSLTRDRELRRLQGHDSPVDALAFSPDGTRLATAAEDATVLAWDLVAPIEWGTKPTAEIRDKDLDRLWNELAKSDPAVGYDAARLLVTVPLPLLKLGKERVRPDPQQQRLQKLIADLDSAKFAERERATRELKQLGAAAVPALRETFASKPPLEVARRVEDILDAVRAGGPVARVPILEGEALLALRLVAILEHIGTPEAREILQTMAAGAVSARVTAEAKAALERKTRKQPLPRDP